jgi:ABC-type enterobactin transport system permease subunit
MTTPPTYSFKELGPQAQAMSRNCNNERLAMILQYVAIGSMIIMAGAAASQVLKDAFGTPDQRHSHRNGRSR